MAICGKFRDHKFAAAACARHHRLGLVTGPGIFNPCLRFIKGAGDVDDGEARDTRLRRSFISLGRPMYSRLLSCAAAFRLVGLVERDVLIGKVGVVGEFGLVSFEVQLHR